MHTIKSESPTKIHQIKTDKLTIIESYRPTLCLCQR
uniref:Uncharacterized protein n=1 Tax=Triticum urartu TaxID=4572 RepID=A0A8R7TWT4_TRIUA